MASIEIQLRLLLADRRVAWLADHTPEYLASVSRFTWCNAFQPSVGEQRWSRVVAFSTADIRKASRLLAPRGWIILVEKQNKSVSFNYPKNWTVEGSLTDDGFKLTLIGIEGVDADGKAGQSQLTSKHRGMFGWEKWLRRWLYALQRYGLNHQKDRSRFMRDLAVIDREMAKHHFFYLNQIVVKPKCIDPAMHYLLIGADQQLNPHPNFSTRHYLAANPDVLNAGVNPLIHYEQFGRQEGRMTMPVSQDGVMAPPIKSSVFAKLRSRPPAEDLWLLCAGDGKLSINWNAMADAGPCSFILLATGGANTTRWFKAMREIAKNDKFDVIVVVPDSAQIGVPTNLKSVICGDGLDPVTLGIMHTVYDRIILCADTIRPLSDAIATLMTKVTPARSLVSARLMTPSGILLSASTRSSYKPVGNGLAPRWFVDGKKVPAGPLLVAGMKAALATAAAEWRHGNTVTASFAPKAMAFIDDQSVEAVHSRNQNQVDRMVVTRLVDNHKRPIRLVINDWIEAVAIAGNALRLFIADLIIAHDSVDLCGRKQLLPLVDLEWLGEIGLEWSGPSHVDDKYESSKSYILTSKRNQPSTTFQYSGKLLGKRVSFDALRRIYSSDWGDHVALTGFDALRKSESADNALKRLALLTS